MNEFVLAVSGGGGPRDTHFGQIITTRVAKPKEKKTSGESKHGGSLRVWASGESHTGTASDPAKSSQLPTMHTDKAN